MYPLEVIIFISHRCIKMSSKVKKWSLFQVVMVHLFLFTLAAVRNASTVYSELTVKGKRHLICKECHENIP